MRSSQGKKDKGLSLLKSDLAHICRRLNLKWTLKPTSKWRLLELVSNLNYRTKLSNISASGTTKELRYITNMKVTCLVICQAWENCLLVISQNINSNNCYHIVVCTSEYMYIKSIKAKKKRHYNVPGGSNIQYPFDILYPLTALQIMFLRDPSTVLVYPCQQYTNIFNSAFDITFVLILEYRVLYHFW